MKLEEATRILERGTTGRGYCVSFEWREGGFTDSPSLVELLRSDHFPDWHAGEPMIADEREAWGMAEALAAKLGPDRICNVRVQTYEVLSGRLPSHLENSSRKLLPR